MDKNQVIGFILIFMILVSWSAIIKPRQVQQARDKYVQDSIAQVQKTNDSLRAVKPLVSNIDKPEDPIPVNRDSIQKIQLETQFGDLAQSMQGEAQTFTLQNDLISVNFSNKGGNITGATLNNHFKIEEDKSKSKLQLLEDPKNEFAYLLPLNGQLINSGNLFFDTDQQGNRIVFSAKSGNTTIFTQEYTLEEDGYGIDYKIKWNGLNPSGNNSNIKLLWTNYLDKLENNVQFEKRYSTVYYKLSDDDDSDYCSCVKDDEENLNEKVDWVSHVNQFFNSALMSQARPFESANLETDMLEDQEEDLKLIRSQIEIPNEDIASGSFDMKWYLGPNEFTRLKAYDNSLEEVIPFGRSIFGTINRWVIRPFFDFLSQYIGSKGIVIIVLIFIIKMLLYPLTYKMLHSQARMGALKPEIEALKKKNKDDSQKQQMATMQLYREYGVSPLGGCMPMILQMPIWYALFRFFPASITFRQEPFLWATDLSSFDVLFYLPFEIPMAGAHLSLFTVLWAITTVIYTYYNTKHMDMSANPAMKYVQYFMPVMFLVFFNNYASGLTCYMFFSNLINIAQTVITKKFVFDEEKIRKELEVEKQKPKKKGGFQSRLEEAMKQQQKIQAEKNRKKGRS